MRRVFLAALLALAIFGAAGCATHTIAEYLPVPPSTPIYDHQIVPGVRVGPVALGMTALDLYRAMGEPAKSIESGRDVTYSYRDLNVIVDKGSQRVYIINVASPQYATESGITVGTNQLALKAHLGSPCKSYTFTQGMLSYRYDYRGVTIWLDGNGNVTGFYVNTYVGC